MCRSVPEGPVDSLALERPEVLVEGPVQALRLPVAGLLPPRVHPAALGPDRFLHPLNCRSRLAARHQLMGHGSVYVKVRGLWEDVLPAEAPAGESLERTWGRGLAGEGVVVGPARSQQVDVPAHPSVGRPHKEGHGHVVAPLVRPLPIAPPFHLPPLPRPVVVVVLLLLPRGCGREGVRVALQEPHVFWPRPVLFICEHQPNASNKVPVGPPAVF
mmetsp:Transcript_10418/g.37000  ORF Transcript_10418/g.37000 Transcript_10418/m.37000 type:complete len:215 (+) Transcript_10418:1154-1798(+)